MNKTSPLSEKEALQKAMRICSTQEKCTYDILKKFQLWGITRDKSKELIDKLIDDKFIDNERYTMFFVKDKFRINKWGRVKIRFQLKQKGISDELINKSLQQITDEDYKEVLHAILKKKLKSLKTDNNPKAIGTNSSRFDNKVKLVKYAESKGFEIDEILRIADKVMNTR